MGGTQILWLLFSYLGFNLKNQKYLNDVYYSDEVDSYIGFPLHKVLLKSLPYQIPICVIVYMY